MRPITLLALVATATTSVASPLPPTIEHVLNKVTGGHRRSDSMALELGLEGLKVCPPSGLTYRPLVVTDHSKKHHELVNVDAEVKHHGNSHRSLSVNESVEAVAQVKPPSRSRVYSKRHVVDSLPSKAPASDAGLVDVHAIAGDAHVVQTPGKDKTIVDVNPGPVDVKVNLPTEGPVKDGIHDAPKEADDAFKGAGKNPAGKKGGPLDGMVNDGKGGPQGLEVSQIQGDLVE